MNIMVYDVAAENGGAISILEYFYNQHKKDKDNHYVYMLSTYHLEETDNVTVVNVPEIKKNWGKRLLFDYIGVRKYIRKFQVDEVLSLQNTIIPFFHGRQTVYEHNALPFSEYRFSVREDMKMWVYQNIIGRFMISGIKKADRVIVQTEWMRNAIAERIPEAELKTEVRFPEVSILDGFRFMRPDQCVFFYPANEAPFKNHRLILDACLLLKKKGIMDYSVVFTLKGDETEALNQIREKADSEMINMQWIGSLLRETVFEWYSRAVLLFPSYIETVGLPIFEAKYVGCPLLLADCAYARNVAGEYKDVTYFPHDDAAFLAECMEKEIMECRKRGG